MGKVERLSLKALLAVFNDGTADINAVKDLFLTAGKLVVLKGVNHASFSMKCWPSAPGVYLVRKIHDAEVVYIGMCGKIIGKDGSGISLNNGRLSQRANRWTPYAFQSRGANKGHWEYGPKFKGRKKPVDDPDNYRHRFKFEEIFVECYVLDEHWREISPTFLESLLLQGFVNNKGTLPLANNEF